MRLKQGMIKRIYYMTFVVPLLYIISKLIDKRELSILIYSDNDGNQHILPFVLVSFSRKQMFHQFRKTYLLRCIDIYNNLP